MLRRLEADPRVGPDDDDGLACEVGADEGRGFGDAVDDGGEDCFLGHFGGGWDER